MAKKKIDTVEANVPAPINVVSKGKSTKIKVAGMIDLDVFVKASAKTGMNLKIVRSIDDAPVTQRLSTGSKVVDMILGGGIPVGKQIELIGYQSSGKTSLAMEILINLVNVYNGYAFVVDHEDESWDWPARPVKLGLDPKKLDHVAYGDVSSIEQVFDRMEAFIDFICIQNKVRDVPVGIFVDSIAAFSSKEEIEAEYGLDGYMTQARVIAKGHRKIRSFLATHNLHNVFFVFLNQARDGIAKDRFHAAEIETLGGKAVRFFSAIRVMMEHSKQLAMKVNETTLPVGIRVKVKTIKNKTYPALQSASLRIMFKTGFDNVSNVYDFLTERTKLIKETTAGEAAVMFAESPESQNLTEKEYEKQLKRFASTIPFKMELPSGIIYFGSGSSFRQIYKTHGDEIVSLMTKTYNDTIEQATKTIAGFQEDTSLYDNIAELSDEEIDKADMLNEGSIPTITATPQQHGPTLEV